MILLEAPQKPFHLKLEGNVAAVGDEEIFVQTDEGETFTISGSPSYSARLCYSPVSSAFSLVRAYRAVTTILSKATSVKSELPAESAPNAMSPPA